MIDTPDTSRANDRPNRGLGNVPLDRRTDGKLSANKRTGGTAPPRAPAQAASQAWAADPHWAQLSPPLEGGALLRVDG